MYESVKKIVSGIFSASLAQLNLEARSQFKSECTSHIFRQQHSLRNFKIIIYFSLSRFDIHLLILFLRCKKIKYSLKSKFINLFNQTFAFAVRYFIMSPLKKITSVFVFLSYSKKLKMQFFLFVCLFLKKKKKFVYICIF